MRVQHVVAIVAGLCAALVLPGCAFINQHQATTKISQHIDHIAAMALTVESRNGGVEIIADKSRTDVEINATLTCSGESQSEAQQRLSQASLNIARDSSQMLVIKPVFPGGGRNNDGCSFTIRLPDARNVTVDTRNGKVAVSSLAGTLQIGTSNASVGVTDHSGPATITTSNGSVKVTHLAGTLKVHTSNGSVDAQDVAGESELHSSNGSITLTLAADQRGPISLKTSNASIKASVGTGFSGSVKLDTSNASVNVTDNAGRVRTSHIDEDGGHLTIGDDGSDSTLTTSNGRIDLVIAKP